MGNILSNVQNILGFLWHKAFGASKYYFFVRLYEKILRITSIKHYNTLLFKLYFCLYIKYGRNYLLIGGFIEWKLFAFDIQRFSYYYTLHIKLCVKRLVLFKNLCYFQLNRIFTKSVQEAHIGHLQWRYVRDDANLIICSVGTLCANLK